MSNNRVGPHLVGPFSVVLKYEAPQRTGFLGTPRNNIHVPGWGEPYRTPDGKPIVPGTFGGANAAALVSKRRGKWGAKRYAKVQKFGEVSWRGPKKSAKKDAPRFVLSFHGPSTRHFATDSFSYGSESKHRHVYTEGGLAGIAPGPVLGACLKSVSGKHYLIVVCQSPEGEAVLRRAFTGPVYSSKEAVLAKLAQFADDSYPDGWRRIGTVDVGDEYLRPKTPWFFNEAGTEAQCMRRKQKDGTFNGETRPQTALDRFKLTVSGASSASVVPLGNLPAYQFKESGQVHYTGLWDSPPDAEGYPHRWDEAHLEVNATCSGEQVVAVDYDGNEEVLVKAVVDVNLQMVQEYMCGRDDLLYDRFDPGPPSYRSGHGGLDGQWFNYSNPFHLGETDEGPHPRHMGTLFWNNRTKNRLTFTRGGKEQIIPLEGATVQTEEEFLGLPRNPGNSFAFRTAYEVFYVRHLDVRTGGIFAAQRYLFEQFHDLTGKASTPDMMQTSVQEIYDRDLSDDEVHAYLEKEPVKEPFYPTYHRVLGRPQSVNPGLLWYEVSGIGLPSRAIVGWSRDPWSWEATTWTGQRPDNNDSDALGNISVRSWFPQEAPFFRNGWYGTTLLFHEKNVESACFCSREDKTSIISGELPHPDTGVPTSVLVTEPPEIATHIAAAVYYPIGEV